LVTISVVSAVVWTAAPAAAGPRIKPVNTQLPALAGTAQDEQTLTATSGTWTGSTPMKFAYGWLRCDGGGAACLTIIGASTPSYGTVPADVGSTIRVQVTAKNSAGSTTVTSYATAVVVPAPPQNTAPPTVSGLANVGSILTVLYGAWAGTPPLTFKDQWQRCDSTGANCSNLAGQTNQAYVVVTADLGFTLRDVVLATNSVGIASAATAPTSVVTPPGSDPVIGAAGDIACDPASSSFNGGSGTSASCRQLYTSDIVMNNGSLAGVLPLGDNQYYCGGLSAFNSSYDLSWGRFKSITHPAVGNHEYLTSGGTGCDASNAGASGYFNYFGASAGQAGQGWYSYDVGTWHVIALNSNCGDAGGCSTSTPQGQWLAADLAAHKNMCTLAYWHIPLFSSGGRASSNSKSFWDQLYAAGADVVLSAHDHTYERLAPQTPAGVADPARGIREFVVGTGGANHTTIPGVASNSEVRNADTYGVLQLTLHQNSYDWKFQPEAGKTFTDSGSTGCH